MSYQRMAAVACDKCHRLGPTAQWITDARDLAKRDGWKRVGTRDICPDHIRLAVSGAWYLA